MGMDTVLLGRSGVLVSSFRHRFSSLKDIKAWQVFSHLYGAFWLTGAGRFQAASLLAMTIEKLVSWNLSKMIDSQFRFHSQFQISDIFSYYYNPLPNGVSL